MSNGSVGMAQLAGGSLPGWVPPSEEEKVAAMEAQRVHIERMDRMRILELASKYSSDQVIRIAGEMLAFVNGEAK